MSNKKIFIGVIIIEFFIIGLLLFRLKDNLSNPYKIQKITGGFISKEDLENICFFEFNSSANGWRRDFCYYTKEKPKNVIRILALGDSFTYGLYLPLNQSWPKLLEKRLNNIKSNYSYQVLNFGVGGLSASEKVNLLYSEGLNYTPDIVIFHYVCDDLVPKKICCTNNNKTEVNNWYKTNTNYTLLFEKEVEVSFKKLANLAQKNNIKILMMFDPTWEQFNCKDYQEKKVEKISMENGWGFLDLSPILEKYDRRKILLNESMYYHPNLLGYEIRTDAILDYLLFNDYINNSK